MKDFVNNIKAALDVDWIPSIYKKKIRTIRTRAYSINAPEKENAAEIMHTLLGIELKIGNKRLACPDLSTARYLQVFTRLGCKEVAIPYDISKISVLADELESARQKMYLMLDEIFRRKSAQTKGRARSALIKAIRAEIAESGAGEAMPEFRQNTKQNLARQLK